MNNQVLDVEAADRALPTKACEFLAENMKCDGYTLQTKAKFISDFREYIKGEE